jgi:3-isopropylmalate/(R)-2-methylmalate dehydratase small subunit
MTPFTTVKTVGIPFDEPNVDTNQICPTRFNKVPRGTKFSQIVFHDRRFDADGNEKPDFVLNREPYRDGGIIVADRNFGCGSSRETAVYGLAAFGIRAVVASSYGDIFFNNCFRNGVLPVILPNDICVALRAQLHANVGGEIEVDLERQIVRDGDGVEHHFDVHPLRKKSLVSGLDDIALSEGFASDVQAFEENYRAASPWLESRRYSATSSDTNA